MRGRGCAGMLVMTLPFASSSNPEDLATLPADEREEG